MEYWDIYDIHRNKTNNVIKRGKKLKDDQFHTVVAVCIFNRNNQMLIQQRQPFKQGWPNLWDITAAGSAITGDTSQQAASRELFEEIGFKYDFTNVRPNFTINFDCGFSDFYLVETSLNINELTLQYEEVQQVKWATKEEILSMIDSKLFISYYKSIIELCFAMKGKYGSHTQ